MAIAVVEGGGALLSMLLLLDDDDDEFGGECTLVSECTTLFAKAALAVVDHVAVINSSSGVVIRSHNGRSTSIGSGSHTPTPLGHDNSIIVEFRKASPHARKRMPTKRLQQQQSR